MEPLSITGVLLLLIVSSSALVGYLFGYLQGSHDYEERNK